jgi:hypothetical protein
LAAWGQPPAQPSGVLAVLSRGQHVAVQEGAGRFEINAFVGSGMFLGSEVVDVGSDFVVLRDLTGVTETRIPVTSIKAVVTGRSNRK